MTEVTQTQDELADQLNRELYFSNMELHFARMKHEDPKKYKSIVKPYKDRFGKNLLGRLKK